MRPTRASIRAGCWIGTVAAAVAAAGCAQGTNGGARTVTIGEFAQPVSAGTSDELTGAPGGGAVGPVAARARDDVVDPDPFEFEEYDDFSDRSILRPTRPGEAVVVDSLVGHVNGRPVFADAFLEPIEDRLLRAAEDNHGVERELAFRKIINDWLQDVVTNELLLAEAQASLSFDEQRGLFAWLRMMYDEEIRRGGGTRSGAEQRRRQSGENLDSYLGEQKDMVLIHQLQQSKIQPRVIVSWRDSEREYQRRYSTRSPSPPSSMT
jgi:hypothetical protein